MHMGAEHDRSVEVEQLECGDGGGRDREVGEHVTPLEAFDGDDLVGIDGGADRGDQHELEAAHDAGEHDRRDHLRHRLGRDRAGERAELAHARAPTRGRDRRRGGALRRISL